MFKLHTNVYSRNKNWKRLVIISGMWLNIHITEYGYSNRCPFTITLNMSTSLVYIPEYSKASCHSCLPCLRTVRMCTDGWKVNPMQWTFWTLILFHWFIYTLGFECNRYGLFSKATNYRNSWLLLGSSDMRHWSLSYRDDRIITDYAFTCRTFLPLMQGCLSMIEQTNSVKFVNLFWQRCIKRLV